LSTARLMLILLIARASNLFQPIDSDLFVQKIEFNLHDTASSTAYISCDSATL